MLNITLSLLQTAEVVTDLSRGKTASQVAARKHLPIEAVEATAAAYGPGRADLAAASRRLNKQLRDQQPVEDLEPEPVEDAPRRAIEDEPIESDPVDVRVWSCGQCPFDLMAPQGTTLADAEYLITEHRVTHRLRLDPEQVDVLREVLTRDAMTDSSNQDDADESVSDPVNQLFYCGECGFGVVGPADDAEFDQDVIAHQAEHYEERERASERAEESALLVDAMKAVADQLSIAASQPAHNHTNEEVRYPTCPACRADAVVPVIVEGEVADDDVVEAWIHTDHVAAHDPDCEACKNEPASAHVHPNPAVYWGGCPKCREEMGYPQHANGRANGHEPLVLADLLAPVEGFAHTLSSARSPLAEAQPATGPQQPVVGVEEPPAAPAPVPAEEVGWLAAGPRTVERLLDEAERTGHAPLQRAAAYVRGVIQELADSLDRWVATADQRKAILHELDILGRRQDELTERLARLDAGIPSPHPVDHGLLAFPASEVLSRTPTDWREAMVDVAAAPAPGEGEERDVASPELSRVEKLRALPFNRMSIEARARCKAWATQYGLQVTAKGMQPKATVAAYLAAHPEDDPRTTGTKEDK